MDDSASQKKKKDLRAHSIHLFISRAQGTRERVERPLALPSPSNGLRRRIVSSNRWGGLAAGSIQRHEIKFESLCTTRTHDRARESHIATRKRFEHAYSLMQYVLHVRSVLSY